MDKLRRWCRRHSMKQDRVTGVDEVLSGDDLAFIRIIPNATPGNTTLPSGRVIGNTVQLGRNFAKNVELVLANLIPVDR